MKNQTLKAVMHIIFSFVCVNAMEQKDALVQILPDDVWKTVVCNYKADSIENTMRKMTRLRVVSQQFNKVITNRVIGDLCAACPLEEKNKELEKILENSNDRSYWRERNEMSILIYAGADVNTYSRYPLLRRAAHYNDEKMIDLLLNCGADPNYVDIEGRPVLFDVRSVSIAKKFIKKGVDLHVKYLCRPNILWGILWFKKDIEEFLRLYSDHDVDFTVLKHNNNCLLHQFVEKLSTEGNQYKGAIEFLINKIPHLLNKKNNQEKTPLDIAYEKRDQLKSWNESGLAYRPFDFSGCNAIIALLEKYGAKRAGEL